MVWCNDLSPSEKVQKHHELAPGLWSAAPCAAKAASSLHQLSSVAHCVIVKIRAWAWAKQPGEKCVSSEVPPRESVASAAEQSREAWRGAIITEWGRNANQPAMRWVWVGRDAHAYHTGLWKTTPPEAPAACFYCVYCSRHSLPLFKQL